jgi:hypothetical protein
MPQAPVGMISPYPLCVRQLITTDPIAYPDTADVLRFEKAVIPGEPEDFGRDPESRELLKNQTILDPPPKAAGDDELRHSLPVTRRASRYKSGIPAMTVFF